MICGTMRTTYTFLLLAVSFACTQAPTETESLVSEAGPIVIEAESFDRQSLTDVRQWYVTSATDGAPAELLDLDPSHAASASGGAYLEILPDTRATPEEELVVGENFINEPGQMAVLEYEIEFRAATTCGRASIRQARTTTAFTWAWMANGQTRGAACSGATARTPGLGQARSGPKRSTAACLG